MPRYRALTTYTVKVSVGLTVEAADPAAAASIVRTITGDIVPFAIQGTRIRHELGAIEMWDSSIASLVIDDIEEDEEEDLGEDDDAI